MEFEKYVERFFDHGDYIALHGLAAVAFFAGVSKLYDPALWLGFEPALLRSLLPLTQEQFVVFVGMVEAGVGVGLVSRWKPRVFTTLAFLWLLGITLTVAWMRMWTIAIRDLGLTALAYYVASREY